MSVEPEPFRADLHRDGRVAVVELGGDFDLNARKAFDRTVNAALDGGPERIDLDVRGLAFIDSTGLGAILRSRQLAEERGAKLRITGPPAWLRRLLQIAGVFDLLSVE